MTELEQARAEATHYKLLFVAGVSYYAYLLPPDERKKLSPTVVAAMDAVQDEWFAKYGDGASIPNIVLAELKRIGGIND